MTGIWLVRVSCSGYLISSNRNRGHCVSEWNPGYGTQSTKGLPWFTKVQVEVKRGRKRGNAVCALWCRKKAKRWFVTLESFFISFLHHHFSHRTPHSKPKNNHTPAASRGLCTGTVNAIRNRSTRLLALGRGLSQQEMRLTAEDAQPAFDESHQVKAVIPSSCSTHVSVN